MRNLIVIGLVIACLVGATLVPLDMGDNALMRAVLDGGHYPLFGCIAVAVFLALRVLGLPHLPGLVVAGFLTCCLVVGVELIQPMVSRTPSRVDMINGGLGVCVALLCVLVWHRRSHLVLKVSAGLIVVMGFLWAMRPAYHEWRLTKWQDSRYPQLAGFEHPVERRLWAAHGGSGKRPSISLSTDRATEGTHSLRVQTPGRSWNSIGFSVGHRDWSKATAVALDVYTAGDLKRIGFDITDSNGVKFKQMNPLRPGWNSIVIPATELRKGRGGKVVSLDSIRYLTLWGPQEDPPHLYYVDNLRVVESPTSGSLNRVQPASGRSPAPADAGTRR